MTLDLQKLELGEVAFVIQIQWPLVNTIISDWFHTYGKNPDVRIK